MPSKMTSENVTGLYDGNHSIITQNNTNIVEEIS